MTEDVIPVGRGQDGIRERRVYRDSQNRRWLYGNWDAHPSLRAVHDDESPMKESDAESRAQRGDLLDDY